MRDYRAIYEEWLSADCFDSETKAELRAIAGDEDEIRERFYMDLEFGTAGLRGILGAGTNRMNKYTVRRATQGLANYILSQGGADKGVVIAYDSRHMSIEFSIEAAMTLSANGIRAYRFESLRPTPELSFAVRELGCMAGINITASHNPPNYNGYKVYWEDGAQFTPPHDQAVMKEVLAITDFAVPRTMSVEDALASGLYKVIGKEIDDLYIAAVKTTILNPEAIREAAEDIRIVYTPLHGTGHVPVGRMLKELGFIHVFEVPEQALPDGDFPTVSYPNPEDKAAFKLALALAEEKNADIVLANDPDADRLGVYVRDAHTGELVEFNGNQSGSIICEYVISQKQAKGLLHDDAYIVSTIVSTDLMKAIAAYYGIGIRECLTGFKWIGKEILKSEQTHDGHYEFGMEESYGCLIGTYCRDKDGISAVTTFCEAVAYYKLQGKTLVDQLHEMYERYGYYRESAYTVTLAGAEGLQRIKDIMQSFRDKVPQTLGSYKVLKYRDYQSSITRDMVTGAESDIVIPKSNVVYFDLSDNAWIAVRPSGTEPKLKVYAGVKGSSAEEARRLGEEIIADVKARYID